MCKFKVCLDIVGERLTTACCLVTVSPIGTRRKPTSVSMPTVSRSSRSPNEADFHGTGGEDAASGMSSARRRLPDASPA